MKLPRNDGKAVALSALLGSEFTGPRIPEDHKPGMEFSRKDYWPGLD